MSREQAKYQPNGGLRKTYRAALLSTTALMLSCVAGQAAAQDAPAPDEIIVTGTSIRGVAPVGSNLVSVGQEELEDIAATNVTELINTIPSITSSGAAPQGPNVYSHFAPSIHGIGGSSSTSTLVLIDGLRMPGGGTQYAEPDPNIIPTSALERVEVIADGASSVYGSDAVSGVINFITRKTYDGAQVNMRTGFGDEYRNYDATAIIGKVWDTGGVYVAGQYTKQDPMLNTARPFIVRGDYRDIGGSNTNSFNCWPASIRTPAGGSGNVFPSPDATTTIPNNVRENGFCNNSVYGNAVPGSERANVLVTSFFEFGDRFSLLTKLNYDTTVTTASEGPGQMGSITVFGAGSPDAAPGQINPFFVAPAGDPTATREQVNFAVLRADGEYGEERQEGDTFYATSVFEAELVNDWTGTISVALGRTNNYRAAYGVFCEPCANLSLNGTPRANADPTESSFEDQSAIVTNFPLTEDNALDVWRGLEDNRTSPEVLDYLYSNDDIVNHRNSFEQLQATAQGSLFSLPAGDIRVAVGGAYMWDRQRIADTAPGNTGNSSVSVQYLEFTLRRSVYSGYAEFYVPVISPDMGIPFANSVDVNISLRHDNYSDFGGTTNPKFAANWEVTPGIRLRGNFAKSFVAPKLRQVGDPDRGFARGAGGANQSGGIDVPVNTYPEVLLLPGCAGATTTCRIGTGVNPGLTRSLGAGLAGTKPQLGESWSVGVDFEPEYLPNFNASVTYWNTKFTGATSVPAVELLLYSGALNDRLTICPTGCTDAQIEEFTQVNNGAPFNDVLPATTYFLIDRNLENLLNFDVAGIDAQVEYEIPTDSIGTFVVGTSITYFTKYDQWIFDKPRFSVLNTSGYNSQFPSVQKRGRAHLGWELGGFSADLFANFTGSYRNYIQTTVEPIVLDANGNPAGGGDKVKAAYTFDLNLSYEGKSGFMTGKRVYVNVKNLFDQDPAFYNGNTSGIGVGGWGYNGFVSNPLGRIVSLGFSANF